VALFGKTAQHATHSRHERVARRPGHTTEIPDSPRQIYTVTYGDPPDPPATKALILYRIVGITLGINHG